MDFRRVAINPGVAARRFAARLEEGRFRGDLTEPFE
jgi:hypothetical protein